MNLPLPEANSDIAAEVCEWLDRFAVCVRDVDYAAARSFWHPDIVIFGTYQEVEEPISLDRTAMGQCVAAHGRVPLRLGKHYRHGFAGWRNGGRDRALDEHRFP